MSSGHRVDVRADSQLGGYLQAIAEWTKGAAFWGRQASLAQGLDKCRLPFVCEWTWQQMPCCCCSRCLCNCNVRESEHVLRIDHSAGRAT
jgi:hypothetical protein